MPIGTYAVTISFGVFSVNICALPEFVNQTVTETVMCVCLCSPVMNVYVLVNVFVFVCVHMRTCLIYCMEKCSHLAECMARL